MKNRIAGCVLAALALGVVVSARSHAAKEQKMVMTVLEAKVAPQQVNALEQAYLQATKAVPPDIAETFLVHDSQDSTAFQIVTVWVSREALDKMRASGVKPKGVQIFEAAGASPKLRILEVASHRRGGWPQ